VRVDVSLDRQLSKPIAQAVKNPDFRKQLLDRPKPARESLEIQIPPEQAVTVILITPRQIFMTIPITIDREVAILPAGIDSKRANRTIRSRILLQARRDPDDRSCLQANPTVPTAEGCEIPNTTTVTMLEHSSEHLHLVTLFLD